VQKGRAFLPVSHIQDMAEQARIKAWTATAEVVGKSLGVPNELTQGCRQEKVLALTRLWHS
jgi:hypothetical protein